MRRWLGIGILIASFLIGAAWAFLTDPTSQLSTLKDPFFWLVMIAIFGGIGLIGVATYYSMRALRWVLSGIPGLLQPTQTEMRALNRLSTTDPASEHAVESARSAGTAASKVRTHIARVTGDLAGSFALAAAVAALTDRFVPQSMAPNTAMRLAIAAVPLVTCLLLSSRLPFYRDALIRAAATRTTRSLLLGYAALIGVASGIIFAGYSLASAARILLVVALAFAAATLWGYGMRRELSGWVEAVIVSEIVLLGGWAIALLVEVVAWPEGIEYFRYVLGMRATPPDLASSGGYEWVTSFFASAYFGLALGSYARTVWRGSGSVLAPPPTKGSPPPAPLFFLAPTGGYGPLAPPADKLLERPSGSLGALAIFSRILPALAVAMLMQLA